MFRNLTKHIVLIGFSVLLLVNYSVGQDIEEYNLRLRPKVGLVLSGGGAKGLSHIGVLKVLDEIGIRPDYITGTSMGSIVGALYAIGYSGRELDSITRAINWSDMLSDNISLYEVEMEEKPQFNNYLSEFTFDENKGISLPSGLIQGQKVHTKFSSLTWRVADIDSFSNYPIPFQCVATDLLTGRPYVFKEGDLVNALRASMSIPSVFAPVQSDSLMFIDGGVTRNYPVQEAVNMGADIIIGVYVGTKREIDKSELQSLVDILGHTGFLGGVKDSEEQMKMVDIEIIPDMSNFGSDNFNKAKELILEGEKAARKKIAALERLAELQDDYVREALTILPENDSLFFESISFKGNNNIQSDLLRDLIRIKKNNWYKPIDINIAIERLYGTGYFDKITYQLIPINQDTYKLQFTFIEKTKGAIKFAIKYDSYFGPGVKVNFSLKSTVLKNDKLFAPIDISPSPKGKVLYQKSMNNFRNFTTYGYGQFEANEVPYYSSTDTVTIRIGRMTQTYLKAGAGFRIASNTRNSVFGEWQWNICRQAYKDGLDKRLKLKYHEFSNYKIRMGYIYHSYDQHYFPSRGQLMNISADYSFNPLMNVYNLADSTIKQIQTEEYYQVFFKYQFVIPAGDLRIMPRFAGGYTWGKAQNMDLFYLGGDAHVDRTHTIPFWGYNSYDLSFNRFALVGSDLIQGIGANTYLLAGANYLRYFSKIDKELYDFTVLNHYGIMLGVGMMTKLGPIWAKWSQVPRGSGSLLFNIGFQL